MDERPGSYAGRNSVSRRTIVMRKAREADAERIARQDEEQGGEDGKTRVLETGRPSSRDKDRERGRRTDSSISRRERTVSGRSVVVHRGGLDRARISGDHAASVRITGGDTIIRYRSGDMVIRRGARRARLRKQVVWAYALGYLVLFSVYTWFLFTGTYSIAPDEFIRKSFSRRHSSDTIDLERAALEAMRGNRTPAEVRLAENLSFYDENHDLIHIAAGDRLTLVNAAKLGKAILEDQKRPGNKRELGKPLRLYRETYLANVRWPYWLTVYNSIGFFLLVVLFLWRPIMNYLGTQGKKTAVALRNAREAQEKAAEFRERYRTLASDMVDRKDRLREELAARSEEERRKAVEAAQNQAKGLVGGIESALTTEARTVKARLGADAALRACERAKGLLLERLGQEEHDVAIDELIADIGGMRFKAETGEA